MAAIAASNLTQKWAGGSAWNSFTSGEVYMGYDNTSGRNYAACVRVKMPGAGIGASFQIRYSYAYGVNGGHKLRYKVTAQAADAAYVNADASTPADGTVTMVQGTGTITASYTGSFAAGAYLYVYVWTGSDASYYTQGKILAVSEHTCSYTAGTASAVAASGQYIGSPVAITITRNNTGFTHKLTWSFGGSGGTIGTGIGVSRSWTPSLAAFGPLIPSATSGTCTITCTTYNGSAQVGNPTSTSLRLYLPESVKPSVSSGWFSAGRVNSGGASSFSAYVQGYSKLRITFNTSKIAHQYGAGAASSNAYRVTFQGKTYKSSSTTVTTDTVTNSGSLSYTVSVYDTRGRCASASGTVTVYAYASPVIASNTVFRCNSSGGASSSGAYCSVKASASVSGVNGLNSYTLQTRYKAAGGSYGSYTALQNGTAKVVGGSLSSSSSYVVEIRLTDTMGNAAVVEKTIPTDQASFHIKEGGLGAAFFGYAQRNGELTVNGDIRIPPGAGRVHTGNGIANTIWTNDIMADAEAMPESTVKFFFGNGADYTDASNLPAAGYAYGTFLVMKRTINYAVIYALGGSGSAAGRLATRSKRSGSWGDWITY